MKRGWTSTTKKIPIRWGYEGDDDEERHGLVEGDVIVA